MSDKFTSLEPTVTGTIFTGPLIFSEPLCIFKLSPEGILSIYDDNGEIVHTVPCAFEPAKGMHMEIYKALRDEIIRLKTKVGE